MENIMNKLIYNIPNERGKYYCLVKKSDIVNKTVPEFELMSNKKSA